MQKYKIKLMPGDHLSSYGITLAQYEEIGNRFIDDGCPRNEFPMSENAGGFRDEDFFGWSAHWGGFYHACESAFSGRLLSCFQVMEKETGADWFERGELPPQHENIEWCGKRGGYWVKARVIDYTEEQICFLHHDNQKYKPYKMEVFNIADINIRPIKSDREKAIEEAVEFLPFVGINENSAVEFLGKLYDAGLIRLPEQK